MEKKMDTSVCMYIYRYIHIYIYACMYIIAGLAIFPGGSVLEAVCVGPWYSGSKENVGLGWGINPPPLSLES